MHPPLVAEAARSLPEERAAGAVEATQPVQHGRSIVRVAASLAMLIGGTFFALWLAGVPPRWSARGAITMKTNMALAQVLAGASLLLLRGGRSTPQRTTLAVGAAALVLLLGAATLLEHVLGLDLGIDQLLASEPPGQPGAASPNRMGPPGALSLSLLGAGLLALAGRRRVYAWLGFATCSVVLVPAVGFVYRVGELYGDARLTVIAWPTVIALLLLGLALGVADPGDGSVPLLWRRDPGGALLRQMAVPAALVPLVIGFVRIVGERRELYERHVGTGLFAVSLSVVFALLLWRSAGRLSAAAAERARERALDLVRMHDAQAALRESEERFRTLADAMPQLVWTARADGTVDYYNCRAAELAGIEREPDGSYRWAPVLHPDDLERTIAAWRRALSTGETYQVEHRVQLSSGSFRWFLSRAVPARDERGRIVRWYGTATEIQAQKEAQHALEEADRRKDDFLGMLSHELRNPLAPIRNALYILERSDPAGPHARRAKDVASRQLSHLTRLVDDLLDVTRIARSKIELRATEGDLAELTRRVAEDHRALLRDRGLALAIELPSAPVPVHADDTRLAQVLGNLLQNAAKFTPAGGTVTVSVSADPDAAIVRVRDTGVGIGNELLPSIFEPFVQAKQTLARSEGGLGLGLALVKGLVAAHGGEVRADSEGPGRGAEFVIRLPLARGLAHGDAPAAGAPPPPSAGRRRILVVDDNRDAAESLAELLALFGHEVEVAFDGPSALARVRRAPRPDAVLCDIGLPGMDGYEVAREIRSGGPRDVRLIAVSGYAQPEDVARAADAGFDGHVAKPPEPESLERLLS